MYVAHPVCSPFTANTQRINANEQDAVKVMAKSLIRNRHAVTKLYGLKSQLQAISLRIQTLKSTQAMADAMMGATKVRCCAAAADRHWGGLPNSSKQ